MKVDPQTVDLAQRDTTRLISTGRLKSSVLLPLAANHGALDDLSDVEGATNGRLHVQETGLPDLDPRELVFGRPGYTMVNAAFTHTRPGGSRFDDESRGAWYCAFSTATALAEVSYHLRRELDAIGWYENATDYVEITADFYGPFYDLRPFAGSSEPALDADPRVAYPAGQKLAATLRKGLGANGIVYPSSRQQGATCLVAFRPELVQNVRQGGVWRLEWQGNPEPIVSKLSR